MDRIFLDANVLFSAAYRAQNGLLRLWELVNVELITAAYAIDEARRNLAEQDQRVRLDALATGLLIVGDVMTMDLPAEIQLADKDVLILASAIQAKATHLVTGDKTHFGSMFGQQILGVTIVPPSDYLADHSACNA